LSMLKETFAHWREDNASKEAAALAFFTVFSLAPLAIVAIGVAGILFGKAAAQGELVSQIEGYIGPQAASLVQSAVQNAGGWSSGLLATLVGIATLLFGATRGFTQLQEGLNAIWNVKPRPNEGIKNLIRIRLLSFGLAIAVGFLLLVSLAISAVLSAVGEYFHNIVPQLQILLRALDMLLSLAVISLLFAAVYRYLPDVEITWSNVTAGAILTSVLLTLGKFLIGLYLGKSALASSYGAAGSLVVILLWVYYSAQIVFFGAELTQVYARHRGSEIRPSKHAMFQEGKGRGGD
jgi:membrane protein